jgi:hypothetical protein
MANGKSMNKALSDAKAVRLYMVIEPNPEPAEQSRYWYGSKRDAVKEHGSRADIHQVDVPPTKAGMLEILNRLAWR